jgi:hypothetical protein
VITSLEERRKMTAERKIIRKTWNCFLKVKLFFSLLSTKKVRAMKTNREKYTACCRRGFTKA